MLNLRSISVPMTVVSLVIAASALSETKVQAAILEGQISGTWTSGYNQSSDFNVGNVGDLFTVDYTYDRTAISTSRYVIPGGGRYLGREVPLLSLVVRSGTNSYSFGSGSALTLQVEKGPSRAPSIYRIIFIEFVVFSGNTENGFRIQNTSGQDADGIPFSYPSSASVYSYDYKTGISQTSLDSSDVDFDTLFPATSVPTPALLPGLLGLGLSVLRRRNQLEIIAVSE